MDHVSSCLSAPALQKMNNKHLISHLFINDETVMPAAPGQAC
jgi:hypothetical protein